MLQAATILVRGRCAVAWILTLIPVYFNPCYINASTLWFVQIFLVERFPISIPMARGKGSKIFAWNWKESDWREKACHGKRRRGPWWYITTNYSTARCLISLSATQLLRHSVSQWVCKSVSQSVRHSLTQLVRQSVSQSVSQLLIHSVGQSVSTEGQSVSQSVSWCSQSVSQPAIQSVSQSVGQSVS